MNMQEQIELLKNISYKDIIFYLAEKGTLEDLKEIIEKIGNVNLGIALCDEIAHTRFNTRYDKAVNNDGLTILEVMLYNNRPLSFFQYMVDHLTKKQPYSSGRSLIESHYNDWHSTKNGFLLDLVARQGNTDYYDFMKNKSFITRNSALLNALLADRKFFKHLCKDFDFDTAFNRWHDIKQEEKEKSSFLNFMVENKNEQLINNFSLLKNREWFIADLFFHAVKTSNAESYEFFKDHNPFLIENRRGQNIFVFLQNHDSVLADFIKKSGVDVLVKNEKEEDILTIMKKSSATQVKFPLTYTLIEKAIINQSVNFTEESSPQPVKKRI